MALTDKLTAIADAIRGKTGGTEGMTLDSMVSAIEGIETGGVGIPYTTGSFTLPGERWQQTITHNLNSTKVFVMYSVRENPAIFKNRYRAIMGVAISNGAYPTRVIDISSYTSNTAGVTEVIAGPDNDAIRTHIDVISPYTPNTNISTGTHYIVNKDPNTFLLQTRENFLSGLTYDWVAVDISGVIPWVEEG